MDINDLMRINKVSRILRFKIIVKLFAIFYFLGMDNIFSMERNYFLRGSSQIYSNFHTIFGNQRAKKMLHSGQFKNEYPIAKIKKRFSEKDIENMIFKNSKEILGSKYDFIKQQKQFKLGDHLFFADILLFNHFLNCYVIVELKKHPIKHKDFAQLVLYCKLMDYEREKGMGRTCGILLGPYFQPKLAEEMLHLLKTPIVVSSFKQHKPSNY